MKRPDALSRPDGGSRGAKDKFRWDVVLLAAFAVAGMYHATRRPAHEIVGAIVIPILAIHLWLNRTWIGELWTRPTRSLPGESRFNRRWNVLQVAFATVALGSGLCASQSLLPALGLPRLRAPAPPSIGGQRGGGDEPGDGLGEEGGDA